MKKEMKMKSLELISKIILKTAEKEANSACLLWSYQPKVPSNLKKLKNF